MQNILKSTLCTLLLAYGHAQAMPLDLHCERNQLVSLGGDVDLDNMLEMKWKGMLYKMLRVGTSTGAHRFEDPASGLILISIPGKAMLLDGRRGEPVANECRARIGGGTVR